MISAIILARSNSTRLKNKHLLKIGEYTLLEHIYLKLLKNKNISEIYLATGSKNKNFIYDDFIKLKKLKIKIFNYKKENNVTERIYKLTKKIKNNYSIIISGDCPAVDNNFINRLYQKIKFKDADFITTKTKTLHEGIILFKNNAWKKVQLHASRAISQENPSYVLSKKRRLFNFAYLNAQKKDVGKKIRISVDTVSDLQFFRLVNRFSNKKIITFQDVIKFRKYSKINDDVKQKKVDEQLKKKIFIITSVNKKIGYGHLSRSKTLFRQIKETYSTAVTYVFYKTKVNLDIKRYINYEKYISFNFLNKENHKNCIFIIDLPQIYFNEKIINFKNFKSIIIDNYSIFKKHLNLIPAIKYNKKNNKENIFSGSKYLILNKDLLFEKLKNQKKIINYLFLFGATKFPDVNILKDIIKSKIKNYLIVLGPYVRSSIVKNLKRKKFNIIVNPENYYQLLCTSKKIICILGVSTYEAISIGIKPSIYILENESIERRNDIKLLNKKKLTKNYEFKDLLNFDKFSKINSNFSFGAKNIIKFLY